MASAFLRGVVGLSIGLLVGIVSAAPVSSIVVFGDSLSDGGNAYALTGGAFPPPPYAQRFSNGPVAVERLAANLGLALTPSLLGGTNYAVGGAETGTNNYLRFNSNPGVAAAFGGNNTGLQVQVNAFTATNTLSSSSLAVLWGGANDLFSALTLGADPVQTMGNAALNLRNEVFSLYGAGARHILLPNMPDIGLTPFGLSLGVATAGQLTAVSEGFALGLQQMAAGLEVALPGLDIIEFDTFHALQDIIANAASLGFDNTTDPCVNITLGTVCANPDRYVFWDDVHPTARVQSLLGDQFTAAVIPEPATPALVAVALLAIYACRRRAV